MSQTASLTAYNNSDLKVTYSFPKGTNLGGFIPAFFVRNAPGDTPALSLSPTPTPNGSKIEIIGYSVVLTVTSADWNTVDTGDIWTGVYDSTLTKNGFINRFVGGDITKYIDGSYGDCC